MAVVVIDTLLYYGTTYITSDSGVVKIFLWGEGSDNVFTQSYFN